MRFGWRTGPDTHVHRAAGALFKQLAGWSAPTPLWLWGGAMAVWALGSEAMHLWSGLAQALADGLARIAPDVFAPGSAPLALIETQGFVVLAGMAAIVAAGVTLAMAWRRRRGLEAGFRAAEARLGEPYLASPGQVFSSLAFVLLWHLLVAGPAVELVWALVAAQAATGIAVRLLVASGERRLLIAAIARGSVRGLGFAASLVLALALIGRAWLGGPDPRPALVPESPPPALAAEWNAAVAASVDGRDFVAGNRSMLEVARDQRDRTVLADIERRLRDARARAAAQAAEQRSRPFTMAELSEGAASAGLVAGGGGRWAFAIGQHPRADLEVTDARVFEREGESWRLAVRTSFGHATVRPPEVIASPEGLLLLIPAISGDGRQPNRDALYRREGSFWRWIETSTWLRQAAHALPPGACILGADYLAGGMAPQRARIRPDYAAMRAVAGYGPEPDATPGPDDPLLDASLGIADGSLVLRGMRLVPASARPPWFARTLAPAPQC